MPRHYRLVITLFVFGVAGFPSQAWAQVAPEVVTDFRNTAALTPDLHSGVIKGSGSDSALYGVTSNSVNTGCGTVYRLFPDSSITVLHEFQGADANPSDGCKPVGELVEAAGFLYGATSGGGHHDANLGSLGTIFRVSKDGAIYEVVHRFATRDANGYYPDGAIPYGGLTAGLDGNFYGTTGYGGTSASSGAYGCIAQEGYAGTFFQLTAAGAFSVKHAFNPGSDGCLPQGNLTRASDGSFLGTVAWGPFPPAVQNFSCGAVFKITPSGSVSSLFRFPRVSSTSCPLGEFPTSSPIEDAYGNLYGATTAGGNGYGAVYKLSSSGEPRELQWLYPFSNSPDGANPETSLTLGDDGNLYGTTSVGGDYTNGTIFRMTPDGDLTTLYSFIGSNDGAIPKARLLVTSPGEFYGTASVAGPSSRGVVFVVRGVVGARPVPILAKLAPDHSGPGVVQIRGFGRRFNPGATFVLRQGTTAVQGTAVNVASDGSFIDATFDFRAAPLGRYDAEVTNPDVPDQPARLSTRFELQPLVPANIDVDLVGPMSVARNRYGVFTLSIINHGNVSADPVHVCIRGIPFVATVTIATPNAYLSSESSSVEKVVCIDYAAIPGGVTYTLSVEMKHPVTGTTIRLRGTSNAPGDPLYDEDLLFVTVVAARDPNVKSGPSTPVDGSCTPSETTSCPTHTFITGADPLVYTIEFENAPDASAPVQELVITDKLDPAKVDLSTFAFGPIAIGNASEFGGISTYTPLPGQPSIDTSVAYQVPDSDDPDSDPDGDIVIRIEATVNTTGGDPNEGLVTWRLTAIDPNTAAIPTNPFRGFLFPDQTPPEGSGAVIFSVSPKEGLASGTLIPNAATVIFDANAPIVTSEWSNTIDTDVPSSAVNPLLATMTSTTFTVSWSGGDPTSGIAHYDVFVSTNSGAYTPWVTNTTATSASFTGLVGSTYAFYSIATDLTGSVEAPPASPDAVTTVRPLVFQFSGFFAPIDNAPIVNQIKAGAAVPVKFSLSGYKGLNIFQAGYPASQTVACVSFATVAPIEETVTASSSSLAYDPASDQYTYVWKTDKAWANSCRVLMVKLSDGSTHGASFRFVK